LLRAEYQEGPPAGPARGESVVPIAVRVRHGPVRAWEALLVEAKIDGRMVVRDGRPPGRLARPALVLDGLLAPGEHELSVIMHFGATGYGVFTYMRGYWRVVAATWRFSVREGQPVTLDVNATLDKGINLQLWQHGRGPSGRTFFREVE